MLTIAMPCSLSPLLRCQDINDAAMLCRLRDAALLILILLTTARHTPLLPPLTPLLARHISAATR